MPETEQQETPAQPGQDVEPASAAAAPAPAARRLDLSVLKEMNIQGLTSFARDLGVDNAAGMKKHDLIFKILQTQTEKSGFLFAEGVL